MVTMGHLQGYDRSHTLALVDGAMTLVEMSCRKVFDEFIVGSSVRSAGVGALAHTMNRVFEPMGFHVARASYARDVQMAQGDRRGRWRSVAALRAMLAAPDDFDDVYRILADDSSRSVFDWFVHARTAAAFVSAEALILYPSPGFF